MRKRVFLLVLLSALGCSVREKAAPPPSPATSPAAVAAAASPSPSGAASPVAGTAEEAVEPEPVLDEKGRETGWQRLHDPVAGYSIRYPDELHLLNDPEALGTLRQQIEEKIEGSKRAKWGLQFYLFQHQPGLMVDFNPNLGLVIEHVNPLVGKITSRKYAELSMQNLPRMVQGAKVVSELKALRLGNLDAWTAAADFPFQGLDLRGTFYVIYVPETRAGYTLTVTDLRKDAERNLPLFRKAVETFRLD